MPSFSGAASLNPKSFVPDLKSPLPIKFAAFSIDAAANENKNITDGIFIKFSSYKLRIIYAQ